ncbi:MAG: hypothetical protein JJ892_03605 [Balneola sp.]|nr:hypothetical protein [Balneola sp.]MBO6650743.1 hypothetical protein [Balneola sp.]MBO6710656.1 hypothetical protein [Balneola sp.]MBO6799342.1 hypothetical protein [Balneola sp.]MBO6869529.1 hypothetical protein [Balneola sp.]
MFDFNSTSYKEFLKNFRNDTEKKRVIVFAGNFAENRKYALSQFETEVMGDSIHVSLEDHISGSETETYKKLDQLFERLSSISSLIIFKNAEQLCGVYVGHTYSVVKYATPQEKYFINKLKELNCSCIIEFENENHLDKAIERVADAIVRFRVPSSIIEKVFFWLSQVRVNGSNLPSRRPV